MENFDHLKGDERLEAENEFLKMKMMLEHGAQFGGMQAGNLPPEIENEFLKHIVAFEQQSQNSKYITIFEKIGRPEHFKPVAEISDAEISTAWKALCDHMGVYGVSLDVCSPNISERELYRFTIEELFLHETDDMNIPGMMSNFIYDEFYPDAMYDAPRQVENNLLRDIFREGELFYDIYYVQEGFTFNHHVFDNLDVYIAKINAFKSAFDEITLETTDIDNCTVAPDQCEVTGHYKAMAKNSDVEVVYAGSFHVQLTTHKYGGWAFQSVEIGGFDPA